MSAAAKAIVNRLRPCCAAGIDLVVQRNESDDWHSLLFDGGRHRITIDLRGAGVGEALDGMRAAIACPDFSIPRHLIVEIGITDVQLEPEEARVSIEALTVAEDQALDT